MSYTKRASFLQLGTGHLKKLLGQFLMRTLELSCMKLSFMVTRTFYILTIIRTFPEKAKYTKLEDTILGMGKVFLLFLLIGFVGWITIFMEDD